MDEKLWQSILRALTNRGGFDGWWDQIDDGTRDEIATEVKAIIRRHAIQEKSQPDFWGNNLKASWNTVI